MISSFVLVGASAAALSGVPGLFLPRTSPLGQRIATLLMEVAALLGTIGAASVLAGSGGFAVELPWPAASGATLGIDALGAFFLVPIFLMGGLGSIYGLGYWPQGRNPRSARRLQLFWGLLTAGMALLVVARQAFSFLLGWEVMALSAFFLITTEDDREECRTAGWIYFIATHIGTLLLFGFFALWRRTTGSFALQPVAAGTLGSGAMSLLFFLALVAFGLKAGIMPLHFWLPGAHANAPSHVSAMLSGVMLKMGIYGLLRFLSLVPDSPASWGGLILALGAVSGLFGVVFAIAQHDVKRLLAYHSVENIGIILMGLGLALLGRDRGQSSLMVLGLAGALLHVWNHGLFKPLLFFGAGSVLRRTGTRQIDRLGGLAKLMPWTAALFLAGAVAICGLPPLNGFVSELLVYLGAARPLVDAASGAPAAVLAVPVLAMIGALAVACFVKVYGAVFLGSARSLLPPGRPGEQGESPASMIGPMLALAALCAFIGVAPSAIVPALEAAIASWSPAGAATSPGLLGLAPLREVGLASAALVALVAIIVAATRRLGRSGARVGTWDCGYARPTSRMQYTASSFGQPIAGMFAWVLRPRLHRPRVEGVFPGAATLESHVDDATLDRVIVPVSNLIAQRFGWFRRFQQGLVQSYVLYILIAVIALLCTLVPFGDIWAAVFAR